MRMPNHLVVSGAHRHICDPLFLTDCVRFLPAIPSSMSLHSTSLLRCHARCPPSLPVSNSLLLIDVSFHVISALSCQLVSPLSPLRCRPGTRSGHCLSYSLCKDQPSKSLRLTLCQFHTSPRWSVLCTLCWSYPTRWWMIILIALLPPLHPFPIPSH